MKYKLGVIGLLMLFLSGCFTFNATIPSMTPVQISTWMNSIYNTSYVEYLSHFEKDSQGQLILKQGVSDSKRDLLQKKKAIFIELQPILDVYAGYVGTGVIPEGVIIEVIERRAILLVDKLIKE